MVTTKHSRTWIRPLLVVLFAFSAIAAWALSSPSGSSPDDDYHLASIWCAQGERANLCESVTENTVKVPQNVVNTPCFAFHNDVTGACQQGLTNSLVETDRANSIAHAYPNGYYWVMSWMASPNVTQSVLAMRILNVALFLFTCVVTFFLTSSRYRRAWAVVLGMTFVPLGIFVVASLNPSSWTLFAPMFVFLLTRSLLNDDDNRTWWRAAAIVAVSAIASSARADAAIFVILAFALGLGFQFRAWFRKPAVYVSGAALIMIAATSVLTGRQSTSALSSLSTSSHDAGLGLLLKNLLEITSLYTGALGGWGLGWLDTQVPSVVVTLLTLCLGGLLLGAISLKKSLRELIEPSLALVLMVAIPLVMSQAAVATIGTFVQPRYVLPLLTLTVISLVTTQTPQFLMSSRQLFITGVVVLGAYAVSLYINLARYTTGLSDMALNLNGGSWQPVGTAFGVLLIGVMSFFLVLLLSYRWLLAEPESTFAVARLRLR